MVNWQRMAAGPADPGLIVTFGTDSEDGSDEEPGNGGGLVDNARPVVSRTAAVAAPTASATAGGGANISSSGLPLAKVWLASRARVQAEKTFTCDPCRLHVRCSDRTLGFSSLLLEHDF